jgi:hypothetical protein
MHFVKTSAKKAQTAKSNRPETSRIIRARTFLVGGD